jgi:hypothetical protein
MFLSDSTWWVLLVVSITLMILLAYREAFRFQLLVSHHGKITTFLSVIGIAVLFVDLIFMVFVSGWWAMLTGLIVSFSIGILTLNIVKRRSVNFAQALVAESEWEDKLTKIAIQNALNSRSIQRVMLQRSINETDIRDLYHRLKAAGVEKKKADAAILNPELIDWFFRNFRNELVNLEDLAIELSLYARYGKKPSSM